MESDKASLPNIEPSRPEQGLTYDAEAVTMIGWYGDQVSAYRKRKAWSEVLGSHFLLEKVRDYELTICHREGEPYFFLLCNFTSACGRYAFWRLMNHQAPDAESKLGGRAHQRKMTTTAFESLKRTSQIHRERHPWIIQAIEQEIGSVEDTTSIMKRLLKFFS